MNESILEILKKMDMETPATKIMIEKVEKEWNISLPCEYKQLILFSNGIRRANWKGKLFINLANK